LNCADVSEELAASINYPEDGGKRIIRNTGSLLRNCTKSFPIGRNIFFNFFVDIIFIYVLLGDIPAVSNYFKFATFLKRFISQNRRKKTTETCIQTTCRLNTKG
jgi:hypothetical protein